MGLLRDAIKNRGQASSPFGDQQSQQQYSGQQSQYGGGGYSQPPQQYGQPSQNYGQSQPNPYGSSGNGYGPPQQSYQGNGGSPAYSQAGPYPGQQQQQQQQGYGGPPNPYSQPPQTSQSQPQCSMARGPLRRPFALPQTSAGSAAPFLRGYSRDLEQAGVAERDVIQFIDALNLTIVPNPEMQLVGTAAGLAGWFIPGLAAGIALTAVQIGAGVGGHMQVKGATKTCMDKANQNVFGPRGLEVELQSTEQFNALLGIFNALPPPPISDPVSRLQMYDTLLSPLSLVLPPAQGTGRQDAVAGLAGRFTDRKQMKQARKAEHDAQKGKMKKTTKLEGAALWLVVT